MLVIQVLFIVMFVVLIAWAIIDMICVLPEIVHMICFSAVGGIAMTIMCALTAMM